MKLYMHPMSSTSRTVMMLCAEQNIEIEQIVVDMMAGEHRQEPYLKINPNGLVPVLDDDGFVLRESSAILKYLADSVGSPAYPKDLRERARVNEAMDWFNTNLYREIGYHLVYPQLFPHHARATEEITAGTVVWGLDKTMAALEVLDGGKIMLAPGNRYLAGDDITIADYFGAELLGVGNLIAVNWSRYPNIERWLSNMRELSSWKEVHTAVDGYAASLKERSFTTID